MSFHRSIFSLNLHLYYTRVRTSIIIASKESSSSIIHSNKIFKCIYLLFFLPLFHIWEISYHAGHKFQFLLTFSNIVRKCLWPQFVRMSCSVCLSVCRFWKCSSNAANLKSVIHIYYSMCMQLTIQGHTKKFGYNAVKSQFFFKCILIT